MPRCGRARVSRPRRLRPRSPPRRRRRASAGGGEWRRASRRARRASASAWWTSSWRGAGSPTPVCSIERLPRLAERARATLEALGVQNVWIRVGNGALGWPDEAPFDRILVAAGGPSVPPPLVEQLAEGGRMVLPVGSPEDQVLTVVERVGGQPQTRQAGECKVVKLVGKDAWDS